MFCIECTITDLISIPGERLKNVSWRDMFLAEVRDNACVLSFWFQPNGFVILSLVSKSRPMQFWALESRLKILTPLSCCPSRSLPFLEHKS